MSYANYEDWNDEDFEPLVRRQGRLSRETRLHRSRQDQHSEHAVVDDILAHADEEVGVESAFTPTFTSSRHERTWILTYLGTFYDKGIIADVLHKAKGGKEANVYCCEGGPKADLPLLAAKVYRPRQFRNLRNDSLYRQGREVLGVRGKPVRDRRALHAIKMGTDFGKELEHRSWLAHEYEALALLHAAGVHVPRPIEHGNNTILMEYVGDANSPAHALNEINLEVAEARHLWEWLLYDVELMLAQGRVHADLSAYNVLYTGGDFRIIDFPQCIDPALHPDAYPIFLRDVTRLAQYFARQGVPSDADALAEQMWAKHVPDRVPDVNELPPESE